jgi:hypothetical protein
MNVVVIGERIDELIAAAATLGPNAVTVAETRDVLDRAIDAAATGQNALVLFLTERDNLADLRAVLRTTARPVLLIAPASPPRAALAKLAVDFGAGLCGRDDPPVVREALLISLAAHGRRRTRVS